MALPGVGVDAFLRKHEGPLRVPVWNYLDYPCAKQTRPYPNTKGMPTCWVPNPMPRMALGGP